jgi:hypothetical protein
VRIDVGPEFDFFDFDGFLFFPRFGGFFLRLEFILAEIHDLADGDLPVHGNLDKIETGFLGPCQGVALVYSPVVLTVFVDELNVAGNNSIIDAWPLLGGGSANWTAYLDSPLVVALKRGFDKNFRSLELRIKNHQYKSRIYSR